MREVMPSELQPAQSQDSKALRVALNARPRVERDFLPGDFVAYWRTQKYERGRSQISWG